MAVFTPGLPEGERKYSVFAPSWDYDWAPFEAEFIRSFGTTAAMAVKGNHAILTCDQTLERVKPWVKERFAPLHLLSAGRNMPPFPSGRTIEDNAAPTSVRADAATTPNTSSRGLPCKSKDATM